MLWDPASPSEAPLYILVRWLSFSAIILAVGALLFPRVTGRALRAIVSHDTARAVERGAGRVALAAAIAAAASAVLRLVMQRMALNAAFAPDVIPWRDVASGAFGAGVSLQIGGGILAIIIAGRRGRATNLAAGLAIAALVLAPGFSGHAAAATPLALSLAADAAHVLTAGTWVGMLAVLTGVAMPVIRIHEPDRFGPAARSMVGAFSPVALGSVAILLVSGVFAGTRLVGSWEALFGTRYGAALLVKIALLLPMLALGALNWRRMGPASGTASGVARFRRVAWGEVVVAVLILLVTAALVGRPSPTE